MKTFGAYLKSCRRERGFENVESYLDTFLKTDGTHLSISHYRNLESGRNLPKLEAALTLCDTLQLNRVIFLSTLLQSMMLKIGLSEEEISLLLRTNEEVNVIVGALDEVRHSKAAKLLHKHFTNSTKAYRSLLGTSTPVPILSKLTQDKSLKFKQMPSEELQEVVSKETLGSLVRASGTFDLLYHLLIKEDPEADDHSE